jgi:hypothetical protein
VKLFLTKTLLEEGIIEVELDESQPMAGMHSFCLGPIFNFVMIKQDQD